MAQAQAEGEIVPLEDAIARLVVHDGRVHTFISTPIALIGADWDLDQVRKEAERYGGILLAGPSATSMGHGLVIRRPEDEGSSVFLETA